MSKIVYHKSKDFKPYEELRKQNKRLSSKLTIARKLNDLLENYRNYLLIFKNNCKCDESVVKLNRNTINLLENEYKVIKSHEKRAQNLDQKKTIDNELKDSLQKRFKDVFEKNVLKTTVKKRFNDYFRSLPNTLSYSTPKIYLKINGKIEILCQEEIALRLSDGRLLQEVNEDNGLILALRLNDKSLNSNRIIGYRCYWSECQYMNSRKDSVSRHILLAHNIEGLFSCNECETLFSSKHLLIAHKESQHNLIEEIKFVQQSNDSGVEVLKRFVCNANDCDFSSNTSNELSLHLNEKHSDYRPFRCFHSECHMTFKTAKSLKIHKRSHESEDEELKCRKCEQSFKTNSELKTHCFENHKESEFVCDWPECEYKTRHRGSWNLHMSRHNGNKPFKCVWPGCESAFVTKAELSRHLSGVHLNSGNYRCDWPDCHAVFKSSQSLKTHKYSHSGVKPFVCQTTGCMKGFTTKLALKRHETNHSIKRNWFCDYSNCNKGFRLKSDLVKHKNIVHSSKRTFKCDWNECQRSFMTSKQLERHKGLHTADYKWICKYPDCSKAYTDSSSLRKHRIKAHPNWIEY